LLYVQKRNNLPVIKNLFFFFCMLGYKLNLNNLVDISTA
jgi:hypothetical protein